MTTPNDPRPPDDLEGRLRRTLRDGRPDLDVDTFLTDVHRGARGRRRRHVAAGVLATLAVIGGGGYAVTSTGVFDASSTPAADSGPTTVTTSLPSTESAPTAQQTSTGARGKALSLSATDTEHQYVLLTTGRDGCRAPCAEVDKTSDGGQTWQHTAPLDVAPSFPDPTEDTVYGVRFAGDGTNGWVFGGALRSTHDGGASWTKPTLPAKGIVTTLESSASYVYASVYDDPSGTATIVRSPVDHDAWEKVDMGSRLRLVSAIAVSSGLVAVLGSPSQVSDDNQINTSTDQGASWNQSSPCKLGDWPSSVSTSANALWTLCSGKTAAAWVTTNAGTTWNDHVPGSFSPGGFVLGRDDTTAVVIDTGAPGISLVTVGNPPEHVLADRGDFLPIGFTNPTTGYLRTYDGGILRTTDSGATWQTYPLP